MMPIPLAVLALFSLLTQQSMYRTVTLVLPHALREGEIASLVVTVGVIPRGDEIKITTPSGRPLGVISPYGIRTGQEGGTYVVPLPPTAVSGTHLSVRFSVITIGKPRAPTKKELKRVRVEVANVEGK